MFKRILLLLSIILLLQAQALPFVGGYQTLQDLNSPDFVKVMNFIKSQYTTVTDWSIVSVQRQLVNGFNYIIDLKSADGATGHFTVYSTFQGEITINSALLNVNSTIFHGTVSSSAIPPSATVTVPNVNVPVQMIKNTPDTKITPMVIAGGYSSVNDPSSESYKKALANMYIHHPEAKDYTLVKSQGQVVNGMNYRFTLAKSDNTQVIFIEYVPLGSAATLQPVELTEAIVSVLGGWYSVTDPVVYDKALKAILKAYPTYTTYTVADVQKQIVSGYNYLITLKNGDFNLGLFKVYIDLQENVSVYAQKLYQAKNYTPATIDNYVK